VLKPGDTVGGFRIEGVLAEGGMSVVYAASQLSPSRRVALKLLAAELGDDPGFRERFRRESRLQAGLEHPHIVSVYEAGESEHGLFFAMRLVPGPTLKERILDGGPLDPHWSVRILGQVAGALDAAHEVGLIHRDVKPQNILIGESDHAYLADFGLTKALDAEALTATGQLIGTIEYLAPEQARMEPATRRSDVYQLAAVLYECLAGAVPFERPTAAAVLFAHLADPPPSLAQRRPDLPEALSDAIARGMAKDPADRPGSAGELMRAATAALV
jgi:serine/threonine protein kinase